MAAGVRYENQARERGWHIVAGVDEAGRGALFGPVVAAAVVLDPADRIRGLNDSKQIPPPRRERLAVEIRARALAWAVAAQDAAAIDAHNILQASRRAMRAAVEALRPCPDGLLVDAVTIDWPGPQWGIVHGDALSVSIAAASILAKVHRDALMRRWDAIFPAYRLAHNKGYGTAAHLAALTRCGPSPLHRRSFAPVGERAAPHRRPAPAAAAKNGSAAQGWLFTAG